MHTDLKNSGLASKFKIRPMTDNISLSQFIGKRVRYRRELLTPEFINLHGSISVTHTFIHIYPVLSDIG